MRKIYILPNLFTAGCLFCGLMAILHVLRGGEAVRAIPWIFLAGVLDVFDGAIARLTRTQSPFGLQFDSLADVVSFGVAPAVIVYMSIHEDFPKLADAACGLYVVCGAMRLARFNVQAQREERTTFLGMPIPGAAGCVLSLFWVLQDPLLAAAPARFMPAAMVVIAYLMVSNFQYVGFKTFKVRNRQSLEILVIFFVIVALLKTFEEQLHFILFGLCLPYALHGPILHFVRAYRARGEAEGEGATEGGERRRRRFRRRAAGRGGPASS